jgi:hypothetical protein
MIRLNRRDPSFPPGSERPIKARNPQPTHLRRLNHGENTPPWPESKITLSYHL